MESLNKDGVYSVSEEQRAAFAVDFAAGYCSEQETAQTIKAYFDKGYLCDPHTAVALYCADEYVKASGDNAPMLVASTASPYKFPQAVLTALGLNLPEDDFECLSALERASGVCPPANLSALRDKAVRFSEVIEKTEIGDIVNGFAAVKL